MKAMKVWRCNYYDPSLGACVSWHATEAAAGRYLAKMQKERAQPASGPEGVEQVQLPTTKIGMLGWLNANLNSDNG